MGARERVYDLELSGVGYLVAGSKEQKPVWSVEPIPAEMGQTVSIAEVPVSWRTWHSGFGYGESSVPGCYHYAEGVDCRWPGAAIMGPLVTTITLTADGTNRVSDIFEHTVSGTKYLYALHGRYCSRINTSTDAEVAIPGTPGTDGADFGANYVSTRAVNFDGSVFVGFSSDHHIYECGSTGTWTQATDDVHAQYWAVEWMDNNADYRLWRAYGTNSVAGCASGDSPRTAANWGAAWAVGDTSTSFTALLAGGRNHLFAAKTDGLYGLDNTGRNENLMESIRFLVDAGNGKNAIHNGPTLAVPHLMGLLEYDPETGGTQAIHPGAQTANRSAVRGLVTAQTQAGPWHYLALYNGTDSYLLAGRNPNPGEQVPPGWIGPKIWHPLAKLTGVRCDAMKLTGLTDPPRLYFGHGVNLAYIRVPKSGDVMAELSSMRFATSGTLYLSPEDFGQAGAPKELTGFELENESFSATSYAQLYVRLDGGDWQQVARAQVPGRSSLRIPSGNWRGHRVEYRLDLTNAASSATLKVKALVAKAAIRPVIRDLVSTTVYCDAEAVQRDRATGRRRTAQDLLDHLKDLQESGPIEMVDYWTGRKRSRQVMVHRVQERIFAQQGDEAARYGAELLLSVLRENVQAWSWDDGTLWDSGAKWS